MRKTVLADVNGWTPLIDVLVDRYGMVTAGVWGRIWRYCQMKDGVCKASMETIASDLHMDRSTVIVHVKRLIDGGFLIDLSPEVRNRPHIIADTGKAGIKAGFWAEVIEEGAGVGKSDTSEENAEIGVGKSNSTVGNSNTRCGEIQHLGVGKSHMSNTSLRDSLRDELRDPLPVAQKNPLETANRLWSMVTGQLTHQLSQRNFDQYVAPLSVAGFDGETLAVGCPSEQVRLWAEVRMGETVDRMLEGFANTPGAHVVFVVLEDAHV